MPVKLGLTKNNIYGKSNIILLKSGVNSDVNILEPYMYKYLSR